MIDYAGDLKKSLGNIQKLASTPDLIRDYALGILKSLDLSDIKYTEKNSISNLIQGLENISETSMKRSYDIIYNQVCILAVSSLSATIETYFLNYTASNWKTISFDKDMKITLKDASGYGFKIKPILGKIILDKDNTINFQDLQSIIRTFKKYFGKEIEIDEEEKKNIIFYQQCRHVLVHKDGQIDNDFIEKTGEYNIKNYKVGDNIKLGKTDWENIKLNFVRLVEKIMLQVNNKEKHEQLHRRQIS